MAGRALAVAALATCAHAAVFTTTVDYTPSDSGVTTYLSRFSYFDAQADSPGRFEARASWEAYDGTGDQRGTILIFNPTAYHVFCDDGGLCGPSPIESKSKEETCTLLGERLTNTYRVVDGLGINFFPLDSSTTGVSERASSIITQSQTNFWYSFYSTCVVESVGDGRYKVVSVDSRSAVDVEVSYYQGDDSWLYYQFSSELSGMNMIFLFFWLLFSGIVGMNMFLQYRGSTVGILGLFGSHHVTRLFSIIIGLQWLEYFFGFCHYAAYAADGKGDIDLLGFAKFLGTVSQCGLILLILLLAKGYTITSSELRGRNTTLIITGVTTLLYVILFIIQTTTFTIYNTDPATYIISWQTWAAVLILIMRVLLGFHFLWEVRSTYMMEDGESQLRFYQLFAAGYFAWLISLPLIVSIAAACDFVVREKVVEVLFDLVNLAAIVMMGFLLRPRSNEFFKLSGDSNIHTGESALPYDSI